MLSHFGRTGELGRQNSPVPRTTKAGDKLGKANKKQVIKRLQPLDVNILKTLYDYRILSTQQIQQHHNLTWRYAYKKISILRNTGYIISKPTKGYNAKQARQGNHHRISETGIACLRKQGYPVERRADDLRVRTYHVPYLLTTNEIFLRLQQAGWTIWDSRYVKHTFNLNRADNVQGIVTSPKGAAYVVYTFLYGISAKNLAKTVREMEMHRTDERTQSGERYFDNYALFAKGQDSFIRVIDRLMDSRAMLQCNSIKVFPLGFGKSYVPEFADDQERLHQYLEQTENLTFKPSVKAGNHPKGFHHIVQHNGEEKYFINLLDTDIVKINHVLAYRKDRYMRNGRKVLVLTHAGLRPTHERLLKHIHHVEFLLIEQNFLTKTTEKENYAR